MFWSSDGKTFYFQAPDGDIDRMDASTKKLTVAATEGIHPLGKVPGVDAVFVSNAAKGVAVLALDGSTINSRVIASASTIPIQDSAGRILNSIEDSRPSRLTLTYRPHGSHKQIHQVDIVFP